MAALSHRSSAGTCSHGNLRGAHRSPPSPRHSSAATSSNGRPCMGICSRRGPAPDLRGHGRGSGSRTRNGRGLGPQLALHHHGCRQLTRRRCGGLQPPATGHRPPHAQPGSPALGGRTPSPTVADRVWLSAQALVTAGAVSPPSRLAPMIKGPAPRRCACGRGSGPARRVAAAFGILATVGGRRARVSGVSRPCRPGTPRRRLLPPSPPPLNMTTG